MQRENISDNEKVHADLCLIYKDKKVGQYDLMFYETDDGTYKGVVLFIGAREVGDESSTMMLVLHLDNTWALVDIKDIRAIHEVINMISR